MRVRAIEPHFSTDGAEHARESEYELEGYELEVRLKDRIVAPASEPACPDPDASA